MDSRQFVKCLIGGVALGGATSHFLFERRQDKPYYNGLYEDDDNINHSRRRDSGNMPPSYLNDRDTNVELKRPETSYMCEYDKIRHYFE